MAFWLLSAKCATEFAGAFFLCLTIALTGASDIAPIAIGCALMVLVYAGGHVSGAHYNPAVTLAIFIRGKIVLIDALFYVMSQLAGAVCGAMISWVMIDKSAAAYPKIPDNKAMEAAMAEFMLTFALCSVVLHTATTMAQANNSYYGLAIGWTVLSGAVSVGPISGGAFNPAVAVTAMLYGSAVDQPVYWCSQMLAAAAAGFLFRFVAREEFGDSNGIFSQCTVEYIGTMMLCYTVGTAAAGISSLAPLSIGAMLMSMVYMGGAISGAHYNPAVSLAIRVRSLLRPTDDSFCFCRGMQYVASQITGAIVGAWVAKATLGGATVGHPALPGSSTWEQGVLAEFLGTFLLAYVVLNVATVRALAGNSFFGIAIGTTVTAMACALGPVSGGAFNPAVGLIGLVTGEIDFAMFVIFWIPCALGGVAASLFFRLQNPAEFGDAREIAFMAHVPASDAKPRFMLHAYIDGQAAAPAPKGPEDNAAVDSVA